MQTGIVVLRLRYLPNLTKMKRFNNIFSNVAGGSRKTKAFIRSFGYLSLILASMPVLTGCADDFDSPFSSVAGENSLQISFGVPEANEVKVRAGEDEAIKNVTVFLFDEEGNKIIDPVSATTLTDNKLTIALTNSQKNSIKTVYAVANGTGISGLSSFSTLENLEASASASNAAISLSDGLLMSGKTATISDNSVSIDLYRVPAAIKVVQAPEASQEFTVTAFEVHKAAACGNVKAPHYPSDNSRFNTTDLTKTVSGVPDAVSYLYPVQGYGNSDAGAFVILRAAYKPAGAETAVNTYYRLNLREDPTEDGEGNKVAGEFLNFEPNTVYTLTITEISGFGHATKEEAIAATGGDDNVSYQIHDHMVNVMSMVTDGVRELGITNDFDWDGVSEKYITVKWYSAEESVKDESDQYTDIADPVFIQGASWLGFETEADGITPKRYATEADEVNNAGDAADQGKTLKYKLVFKQGNYRDAIIRVSWRGLSREVKVIKGTSTANLSDVCDAELQIYEGSSLKETVSDYWSFLAGEDAARKLYGVSYAAMGEKKRNEGFHFAMPYGENYDYEYRYVIKFPANKYTGISGVSLSYESGNFSEGDLNLTEWDGNSCTLTMNNVSASNFSYKVGEITLTVTHSGGSEDLSVKVYHTGFFHKDDKTGKNGNSYRGSASASEAGYYYYEVVTMEGMHWLDRNLGATASGLYIETDAPSSVFPADSPVNYIMEGACGEFYKGADNPGDYDGHYSYGDVVMKDDEICPPGYRIPWKSEFDRVRHSARFIQESSTRGGVAHYTSYYAADGEAGNIHFPKARFENSHDGSSNYTKVGDSRAGYYLTRTQSSGLEKEQIGKWLNALYISGTSTSYVNYSVDNYRMNIRCVAGSKSDAESNPESANTIAFEVKGATHVYLYNKTTHSAIFAFPGKAIGSPEAAKDFIYFSYNSSSSYDDLLVMFAYVDTNGKVTLIHTGKTAEGTDPAQPHLVYPEAGVNVNNYFDYGWKVVKGNKYDLTQNVGDPSDLKDVGQSNYNFRIYWPVAKGPGIHIWGFGDIPDSWEDSKTRGKGNVIGDYYYYDFTSTGAYIGTMNYIFSNLDGTGEDNYDSNGINSNQSRNYSTAVNTTTFTETMIGGKTVWVAYLDGNSDTAIKGFPYKFANNDGVYLTFDKSVIQASGANRPYISIWSGSTVYQNYENLYTSGYYMTYFEFTEDANMIYYQLYTDSNGNNPGGVKCLSPGDVVTYEKNTNDSKYHQWNFEIK